MLGGDGIRKRHRLIEVLHQDDRAEILPRGPRDFRARQRGKLRLDRARDIVGERCIIGDQDRLRVGVVLGLRQQIGGDPAGVAGWSAMTSTSEGPAIMSMPTLPNTSRLAAAT